MQVITMAFETFVAEHGDHVSTPIGFLFRDGSFSNGGSRHQLPPIDERELTRRKKNFLQYKIENTERELQRVRHYVNLQSQFANMSCGPPVDPSYYAARDSLNAELNELRSDLHQLHNGQLVHA